MQLLSDELTTYREDGYLFYSKPILSKDEIAAVLDEIGRVSRGEAAYPPFQIQLENGMYGERNKPTDENPIRKLQSLSYYVPFFEKLARDARIVDVVESIIGPDIKLYTDEYFCKNPARAGKPFAPYHWHQDSTNYSFFAPPDKVVTCWIALDAATPENGCMQFIPRSHVYGSIPPGYQKRFVAHPALGKPVYAPREPGYAVFHDGLNFHSSAPNMSTKPRRAIAFHYMSAQTLYTGIDDPEIRRYVEGENSNGGPFRFKLIRGREYENRV